MRSCKFKSDYQLLEKLIACTKNQDGDKHEPSYRTNTHTHDFIGRFRTETEGPWASFLGGQQNDMS